MELDGGEFFQNVPFGSDFGHHGLRITGTYVTSHSLNFAS